MLACIYGLPGSSTFIMVMGGGYSSTVTGESAVSGHAGYCSSQELEGRQVRQMFYPHLIICDGVNGASYLNGCTGISSPLS